MDRLEVKLVANRAGLGFLVCSTYGNCIKYKIESMLTILDYH